MSWGLVGFLAPRRYSVIADESLVTCAPRDKRGQQHTDGRGRKNDNSFITDCPDGADSTDLLRAAHDSKPNEPGRHDLCERPREAFRARTV